MTREELRLAESRERKVHWKRWGPYLSERAWGTVREDYSAGGTAPVLSLDLRSGIDATTGAAAGAAVRATWTLTLALPKPGVASDLAGELYLADIGIPAPVLRRLAPAYQSPFDARPRVALARHP